MANVVSIERRNEHTRVELLDDGTHRLTLQRGQNYFDRDTSRFEDSPAGVTADAQVPGFSHRYKAQHWSRFGRGQWKIGFGQGRSITYRPRGAANVVPVSSGRVVTYRELWPGVDLELTAFPEGVKEDLVLKAPGGASSFTFDVELSGVILVQDGHSLQVLDTLTGQIVGRIPAPTVHDAAGVAGLATLTYEAGAITIAVDSAWLAAPERVWPVTLDPTTVIQPDPTAGKDAYVDTGIGSNLGTEINLRCGDPVTASAYTRSYLQPNLSSIPVNAAIVSAQLELYNEGGGDANALTASAYRVTAAWDEMTIVASSQPTFDATAQSTASNIANVAGWVAWTGLTALVQNWLTGAWPNYGLVIKKAVDGVSSSDRKWFWSSDYATTPSLRPKWTITYTYPTVTVTSPNGIQAAPTTVTDDVTPNLSGVYNSADAVNMAYRQHQIHDDTGNLIWDSGKTAAAAMPASTVAVAVPAGYLKYGAKYRWRWMAWDANGGYSAWTANGTTDGCWFQSVMSAPTGLTATADPTNARISLGWTAHPGENLAGYRVYRRKQGGAAWTKLNQTLVATASYTDDAAVSGQSYDYAVSAVATDGYESPLSTVATGSVTYTDTWIDDVKMTAPALTDQTVPFLGSAIPVHGKTAPVVFGRQAARRRTLAGTADGSQAMADLERVLAAGQTHRYADSAQAFRFMVAGDLRAQRAYPVTDAGGQAMEQFDWTVDVVEVA